MRRAVVGCGGVVVCTNWRLGSCCASECEDESSMQIAPSVNGTEATTIVLRLWVKNFAFISITTSDVLHGVPAQSVYEKIAGRPGFLFSFLFLSF
jgi:hypothetical protein